MKKIEPDRTFSEEEEEEDRFWQKKKKEKEKNKESVLSLWVGSVSPVVFFTDSFL